MIVFSEIPLNLEAYWEFLCGRGLFNRHGNGWCACAIRESCVVIHFILIDRVFGLWCVKHIRDFRRSLTYGHRWQNEIKIVRFKDLAVLVNQKSTNFLSLYNLLIKVFKTRREQEVAKDHSSLDVDAKRFTLDFLYIREQLLSLLSCRCIIRVRFILEIELITILQTIISGKVRRSLWGYQGKIERKGILD